MFYQNNCSKKGRASIPQKYFFGGGDYYIDSRQKQELNDFLDGINSLEQYQITVTSRADTIGSLEYNQWLSQMRSTSTIRLLELRGIPEAVIQRKDYGELNPDFDNRTWEGKLRNRRADVILIPPDSYLDEARFKC